MNKLFTKDTQAIIQGVAKTPPSNVFNSLASGIRG
jgi:hypothetical protein